MSMWRNNMHMNRSLASRLFMNDWTPAEIAQVWSRIWRCTKEGLLAKRVKETTNLTMCGVDRAIRLRKSGMTVDQVNAAL